jgi:hypothetical protein
MENPELIPLFDSAGVSDIRGQDSMVRYFMKVDIVYFFLRTNTCKVFTGILLSFSKFELFTDT